MQRHLLAAVAGLALSAGSALAAGPDANATAVPAGQPVAGVSGYYGYYSSGYLFPDDGSPSGDQATARPVQQPQGPGLFSRIYLFPPSEGSDMGGGAG
jgi:hypothetical protein